MQQRRESAYEQMFRECGGEYDIVAEWNEVNGTLTSVTASGRTDSSTYGAATPYGWNATEGSSSSASAVALSQNIRYRLIDFECRKTKGSAAGSSPALSLRADGVPGGSPTNSGLLPTEATGAAPAAPASGAADRVRDFLSLETGCAPANIIVEASMRGAHRVRACGRSYLCVEGDPVPTCRFAMSELDGGQ
ncbi:MAG: hypothetical protein AMXMBFR34_10030 [Myxococcaceae bacterium]